ncbi:MAG: hypothetical protein AB1805_13565 [Nitrospirota bacterium]
MEIKRVLVTVKAYPNPSKKYSETVCIAGIDLHDKKWIRLYPVPFRDLEDSQKFKKYSIIEVRASKARADSRPESYKIDSDSIAVVEQLDTKNNWERRKQILLPSLSKSLCEIYRDNERSGKSLGMFKPHKISFTTQKIKIEDSSKREECYNQRSLFRKDKCVIEAVPFEFRYQFSCFAEPDCPGHDLLIIDWEINQAFRSWRYKYKQETVLLQKIEERWLNDLCSDKKDTYFIVGNMARFRKNFMLLGVFYPGLSSRNKY